MQVDWYIEQVAQEEQLSQEQDDRDSEAVPLNPVRGWPKKPTTLEQGKQKGEWHFPCCAG